VTILLAGSGVTGPAMADGTDVLRWQLVGHIADKPVEWLAIPPDGLSGGVLFARVLEGPGTFAIGARPGPGSTRRSRDGGQIWDAVPDPPGRVLLPPGGVPAFSLGMDGVYRSTDTGDTWSRVTSQPGVGEAQELLFSPAFQRDGIAFLRGADQLWRTTDSGATWTNLDPGQGQVISTVRLSPAFASDHTIFVGAVSARPDGRSHIPPPTDYNDSLGVLVSQDAGASWTSVADGLQIDGSPYHQVVELGVSANFAQDQTLLASALGPWQPPRGSIGALPTLALFRSSDGGASWDVVDQAPQRSFFVDSTLRLSPAFGGDHTLEYGFSQMGGSPSSSLCFLNASGDAGDSWTSAEPPLQSAGMCAIGVMHAADATALIGYVRPYYLSSLPNRNIYRSLDGGASWSMLSPPGDGLIRGYQDDLIQRQVILADRVFQATQQGDLWEYGAFPPCAIQPVLGFGQVWSQNAVWQEGAGCPVAEEQAVDVHTRRANASGLPPTDYYWINTGDAACVEVSTDFTGMLRAGSADAAKNCAGAGERTVPGALQRFQNGQFWLYVADAPDHRLVINSQGGVVALAE
jgi:photosystem II stability/assembly factor-like uncharacterized protein